MTRTRHPIRLLLLLCLSAATFLLFIGLRDIATSHEARVVQVARHMAAVGWPWEGKRVDVPQVEIAHLPEGLRMQAKPDGSTMSVNPWLVPVINGQIRLQKPPLPYWCSAILFRTVGFGEGVSRFVPALLGAFSVLLIWDLARELIGRVGAWYAAMVWVSSYFIVDEFRKTMADPYLAFFTLLATWSWIRARSPKSPGFLLTFYLALALGMLSKGPIIFIFVAAYLVLYHLLYRRRIPGSFPIHALGVIIFLVVGMWWYVAIYRSVPNAIELWRYESIGELSDNTEKARHWWFYLPNLLQITLPWTPLWIMGLIYPFANRFKARRFFAVACTAMVVFFFSLSFVKKNAYLLPLVPIQTIVTAQGLLWLTVIFRKSPKHRPVRVPLARTAVLAVIFAIGVQVLVSAYLSNLDNNRSAKDACRFVKGILRESPATSLFVSQLPEEASVYLPTDLRDSKTSSEVLLIADDRKNEALAAARAIASTPAGRVASVDELAVPNARTKRWKVFSLKIGSPVPPSGAATVPTATHASGPGSPRFDTPAPATSSSGSQAGPGNF
jgi:4-amino-4-deoxy-L-arabinose transferase-like glycosyltransferase